MKQKTLKEGNTRLAEEKIFERMYWLCCECV